MATFNFGFWISDFRFRSGAVLFFPILHSAFRIPHWKVPHARGVDEVRRLFPEPDLGGIVEIETIGDDAVARGRFARRQRRLHRAREGRQNGLKAQPGAAPAERRERRNFGQEFVAQAGYVDDHRAGHGVSFKPACRQAL